MLQLMGDLRWRLKRKKPLIWSSRPTPKPWSCEKFLRDKRCLFMPRRAVAVQMLHPTIARAISEHDAAPRGGSSAAQASAR